jgi:peptidoglycan/xylan/chitin deacetylase (PgdA/CDA1 family)
VDRNSAEPRRWGVPGTLRATELTGAPLAKTLRDGVARVEKVSSRLPAPLRVIGGWMASSMKWGLGSVAGADTGDRVIGLTFDDGPDPNQTPAILDALADHGVRATFFMLAERAEAHPELARRVLHEGHEAALHGNRHDILTRLRLTELVDCVWVGKRRLRRVLGEPITFFRPPYGGQNLRSYLTARLSGMEVVVWSAWAHDWEDLTGAEIVDSALARAAPGKILLLHDSFVPHPDRPDAPSPRFDRPLAVRQILEGLAMSSLQPVPVGELMGRGRRRRSIWFESGAAY